MDFSVNQCVAVFSCVHANLEALGAVYDHIQKQKVDQVICLGDLVGYGPHPNETVDFMRRWNIPVVRGCWDEAIVLEKDDCGCKFATEEDAEWGMGAFKWARQKLTGKSLRFLRGLEEGYEAETSNGRLSFVHGSPRSASEYLTTETHELLLYDRVAEAESDFLFCGHTHIPFVKRIEGTIRSVVLTHGKTVPSRSGILKPKTIVNVGSVGEPRHGSPEATYVIFDSTTGSAEIQEVPYPVAKTVAAMRREGMPEVFSRRLLLGKELALKNKETACAC